MFTFPSSSVHTLGVTEGRLLSYKYSCCYWRQRRYSRQRRQAGQEGRVARHDWLCSPCGLLLIRYLVWKILLQTYPELLLTRSYILTGVNQGKFIYQGVIHFINNQKIKIIIILSIIIRNLEIITYFIVANQLLQITRVEGSLVFSPI